MLKIAHTPSKEIHPSKKIAIHDNVNFLPLVGQLTNQQTNMALVVLFIF